MTDITIPKLNNNDSTYLLLEWLAADGASVTAAEPVASIETSKAVEELVSEEEGRLSHRVAAGQQCRPGSVIGYVVPPGAADPGPPPGGAGAVAQAAARRADEPGATAGLVVTEPARELIETLGLDPALLRGLGKKLIREADVRDLAATAGRRRTHAVSPVQAAVAQAVTASHDTIPAAFTAMRVPVDAALTAARVLSARLHALVGLPELLIAATASLHGEFPLFFASDDGDGALAQADGAHVGITIDVGKGLYVPVIRDAGRLGLPRIAQAVTGYRSTALHGRFSERDLRGGNITITLHSDPDVIIAQPLVFPGQTCALSLPGARPELRQDPGGGLTSTTVADIGISYDHRRVNGRDAIGFLAAISRVLRAPGELPGVTEARSGSPAPGGC